ncbi:O-antigen ligase family protein [Flavobacterium davisii]|uniref:O-antigen ligase family protein n=1 Tax=Flavobacterium davisii TaxID=2906077 RepID=UPI0035D01CBC
MSSEDLSLKNSNYNFSFESIFVVLTLSIYLLLDFAPVLNSIDVAGFQWLTMSILNVGIGYFVFHFIKSENLKELRTFKVNNIIILYSIFLFFSGISIFYAPNFSEAILTFNRLILIAFLVFTLKLFSQIKIFFLPNLSIAISIIAFFQSFIAFTSFISKVNEAPLNEIYNILTQNSGNINIFSATLVFKIPFILYGIHYFTGIKKVFFSLTFILVSIILFLTLSRTSIISLLIVSVCFIIASLVKKNNLINTFIVLIGLFIAFGFQTKYLKYLPKKGVIEVYMSDAESDATSGRIYLWKNTIEIIKNSPFLGTGLGSYKIESIPYESKQRTTWSISKYSHNDFLQTASETGIINGLIYLSLFLIIAWKSFKILIKKSTESDTFWLALIVFTSVFAYGFDSSLNFPKERIITQIHFVIITFLFFILTRDLKEFFVVKTKNILVIFIVFSVLTIYPNYLQHKSLQGQNEIVLDENKLTLSSSKVDEILPSFPTLTTLGYQIDAVKARYLEKEGHFDQAIQLLNSSRNQNKNMMINESILATIYTKKNITDSINTNWEKCYKMFPLYEPFFANHLNILSKRKDTIKLKEVVNYIKTLNYYPKLIYIATKYLKEANISNNEIKKMYKDVIKKHPKDSLINIISKVIEQKDKIDTNEADKEAMFLNKLKSIRSDNWEAQLNTYIELEKINPKEIIYTENIAVCYYQLKKYNFAIPYLKKVIDSKIFKNGKSEYIIAACYHYMKQSELACNYAQMALNNNYIPKDCKEIMIKNCTK